MNILSETVKNIAANISVQPFRNASAALAAAETSPPDLIITDYKMPIMDGIEFTQKIRLLPNCGDVPIIMITILESGVTDFLHKPFDQIECKASKNLLALGKHQSNLRKRKNLLEKNGPKGLYLYRFRSYRMGYNFFTKFFNKFA